MAVQIGRGRGKLEEVIGYKLEEERGKLEEVIGYKWNRNWEIGCTNWKRNGGDWLRSLGTNWKLNGEIG